MIAIFEFGTLWFWLLIVAASITVITAQEIADYPGSWSTFWVIVTFALVYWCGAGRNVDQFWVGIVHNPVRTVVYFLLYAVIGTLWSFYKWKDIVEASIQQYQEYKGKFEAHPNSYSAPTLGRFRPKVSDHKAELFNWIFYWPFSFAWFIIHKPIEKLFKFIMERTKKVYEGITDRLFAVVEEPKQQ